jgi:hypothetical protein
MRSFNRGQHAKDTQSAHACLQAVLLLLLPHHAHMTLCMQPQEGCCQQCHAAQYTEPSNTTNHTRVYRYAQSSIRPSVLMQHISREDNTRQKRGSVHTAITSSIFVDCKGEQLC